MTDVFMKILSQHGPWVAVAAFLIWNQHKDYRGVCKRLNEVEDYCKTTLTNLLQDTNEALRQNTECIRRCPKNNNNE